LRETPTTLDLRAFIAERGPMLRRLLDQSIELVIEPSAELHPVFIDPGQLDQALMNLVLNARDAMTTGGRLTISLRSKTRTNERGETLDLSVLSVIDDGCGMAPEVAQRAFELFYSTKESGRGTGLGLASVRRTIEAAGGIVGIDSKVHEGTRVELALPRSTGAIRAQGSPEGSAGMDDFGPNLAVGQTAMILEDEADVRRTLAVALTQAGYRVIPAEDGEEAVSLSAALSPGELNWIISDLMMPKLSGDAAAAAILEHHPQAKVLFVSGHADIKHRVGTFQPGTVLTKPVSHRDILKAMAAFDSDRHQAR
jgi:CheY-like chemotaxis protein